MFLIISLTKKGFFILSVNGTKAKIKGKAQREKLHAPYTPPSPSDSQKLTQ